MPTVKTSSATRPLRISLQSFHTWTLWRWRSSSVYPIPLPSLLCVSLDITARYPCLLSVIVNPAASFFALGRSHLLYNTTIGFAQKASRIGRVTGKVCFYYDIPPYSCIFSHSSLLARFFMHGVQVIGTGYHHFVFWVGQLDLGASTDISIGRRYLTVKTSIPTHSIAIYQFISYYRICFFTSAFVSE
jgi:hypothetical protein